MQWRTLHKRIFNWIWPERETQHSAPVHREAPLIHVIVLDGTMSSLTPGSESNAGIAYRLISQIGAPVAAYYEPGVQWLDWRSTPDVVMGRGINRQIRRAYGYLASRYRPGDKIFLLGYSRGAFAVRSLAGLIDSVGLLRSEAATERNVTVAYRHYQSVPGSDFARDFARTNCHDKVEIEMVGVWDTVKALGVRLPFFWQWSEQKHAFHNHQLGASIKHGFQALALDETRAVFEPLLWDCPEDPDKVQQVWFRGTHGDIGGQLAGFHEARPLSNIPLVWMLSRAEQCGLPLPAGWEAQFPCDVTAPSLGTWRNWGKLFMLRGRRRVGQGRCEHLHETVSHHAQRPPPTIPKQMSGTVSS